MPELPEAETVVRQIRAALCGVRLGAVRHLRADVVRAGSVHGLRRRLPGQLVSDVRRRGKRVVIDLASEQRLVFGLGMSGHVAIVPAKADVAKHTHLRIALDEGDRELRFRDARRFGGIWLLNGSDDTAGFYRIGADPLSVTLRAFRAVLARRRQIKALLIDQAVVAGLGNIYCDEALHRAGINPLARAGDLHPDRVKRLHRSIRAVLTEAIAAEGTTIHSYLTAWSQEGSFQNRLRVYGREGERCRRCGTLIERIIAAGRSTHLCPTCQA